MKTFEIYFYLDGAYLTTFEYAPTKDEALTNLHSLYKKSVIEIVSVAEISDEQEEWYESCEY